MYVTHELKPLTGVDRIAHTHIHMYIMHVREMRMNMHIRLHTMPDEGAWCLREFGVRKHRTLLNVPWRLRAPTFRSLRAQAGVRSRTRPCKQSSTLRRHLDIGNHALLAEFARRRGPNSRIDLRAKRFLCLLHLPGGFCRGRCSSEG